MLTPAILLLADTLGENAELGGMVLVSLALVKVVEKAWDTQAAKRAKESGQDPLAALASLIERNAEHAPRAWASVLAGIGESITELKAISARQMDIAERMDRRTEKVERLLIVLTERLHASDHGRTAP